MNVDLHELTERVRQALTDFHLPDEHLGVGVPLSSEWYAGQLRSLRNSLVAPYEAAMRDDSGGQLAIISVIVVIEDDGAVVVFDPVADEFVLANRCADPDPSRAIDLVACGIRGNPVDCFLSA